MISSIAWIPAGVADPSPKRYEISNTERELLDLLEQQQQQDNSNAEDAGAAQAALLEYKLLKRKEERKKMKVSRENENKSKASVMSEHNQLPADLRMDEYSSDDEDDEDGAGMMVGDLVLGKDSDLGDDMVPDDDDDDDEDDENDTNAAAGGDSEDGDESDDDLADVPDTREYTPIDVEGLEAMGLAHSGGTGGMYADDMGEDEDDTSDIEDVRITADDALIVLAKTEEDFASLEVNVFDQKTGNLFVHHDIPLPSYPLCLAHGQVSSRGTTGNFCAVGTFSPGIEIWNLDVLNALEPTCVLGGDDTSAADDLMKLQMLSAASGSQVPKVSRKALQGGLRAGSHKDAVMALSWNQIHRQVIASGSADYTVKLWDVTQADNSENDRCCASTFTHHRDKVQSVAWHPKESTLLATGSFDRTAALLDARANGQNTKSVKLVGDCEAIAWDPFHSEYLTVASEDGTISCWDVRQFSSSTPLWTFLASEYGGVNNLAYNKHVPGLMVTCSVDATVTLWDTYAQNNCPTANMPPRSCGSKDMCVGKLYAVDFYPSSPWLLGCGGSGNQLALWDLSLEGAIRNRFDARLGISRDEQSSDDGAAKHEDFEAMMATESSPMSRTGDNHTSNKRKKGVDSSLPRVKQIDEIPAKVNSVRPRSRDTNESALKSVARLTRDKEQVSNMSATCNHPKDLSSGDVANGGTDNDETNKNTMMNHTSSASQATPSAFAVSLPPRVGNQALSAPSSPPHRNRVIPTASSPPITHPRLRSSSFGQHHQHPLSYLPQPSSPYAPRSVPVSPVSAAKQSLITMPLRMPFLPAEHTEQRKAMEAAVTEERKRAKEMELQEASMTADELRAVLKRERHRMGRIAADLAVLKCNTVHAQLEAEMAEEGHINTLLRRMDELQQEKGRIIVELEREEEMLTNTLQKQLEEVRRDKAKLEHQIEHEKQVHASLETQLLGMRDKHLAVSQVPEEEEEMEEE